MAGSLPAALGGPPQGAERRHAVRAFLVVTALRWKCLLLLLPVCSGSHPHRRQSPTSPPGAAMSGLLRPVHQLTFTRKTLDKSRQRATPLARLPPALLAGTLHTGALLFSSFQRCRSFSFRTALFGHRGCLMFLNVFDCSGCGVGACGLFFLPEERVAAWRW